MKTPAWPPVRADTYGLDSPATSPLSMALEPRVSPDLVIPSPDPRGTRVALSNDLSCRALPGDASGSASAPREGLGEGLLFISSADRLWPVASGHDHVIPRSTVRVRRRGIRRPARAETADSSGPVPPESLGMTRSLYWQRRPLATPDRPLPRRSSSELLCVAGRSLVRTANAGNTFVTRVIGASLRTCGRGFVGPTSLSYAITSRRLGAGRRSAVSGSSGCQG